MDGHRVPAPMHTHCVVIIERDAPCQRQLSLLVKKLWRCSNYMRDASSRTLLPIVAATNIINRYSATVAD